VARLSLEDVEEVYSLRRALERLAVESFVKNATSDDVAKLEEILSIISQRSGENVTPKEAADLDIEFHEAVIRGARHQRLLEAWLKLREQIRILLLSRNVANQDYRSTMLDAHRALLHALCDADPERAVCLLVEHTNEAYIRLIKTYNGS
jgi:DNA-binding GntR family transcriptional regulator